MRRFWYLVRNFWLLPPGYAFGGLCIWFAGQDGAIVDLIVIVVIAALFTLVVVGDARRRAAGRKIDRATGAAFEEGAWEKTGINQNVSDEYPGQYSGSSDTLFDLTVVRDYEYKINK